MALHQTLPHLRDVGQEDPEDNKVRIKVTEMSLRACEIFDMCKADTVGMLKRRIEGRGMGLAVDQRLAHAGRVLSNDQQTLSEAGVENMSAIFLCLRKREEARGTEGVMPLLPGAEAAAAAAPLAPPDGLRQRRGWLGETLGATVRQDQQQQQQQQHQEGEDEEEPTCRICHGTDSGEGEDRLFSPCLCRGSMRYVHVACLNRWRAMSTNPRSFYACDACNYNYSLRRTAMAAFLETYPVLEASTALVCILLIVLGGFISYLSGWRVTQLLYQLCQWVPPWKEHWYSLYGDFLSGGLILLGLCGLMIRLKKAYDDDPRQIGINLVMIWLTQGTLIVRVLVVLGMGYSLHLVHSRLKEEMKGFLSRCGAAILEVRRGGAPRHPHSS